VCVQCNAVPYAVTSRLLLFHRLPAGPGSFSLSRRPLCLLRPVRSLLLHGARVLHTPCPLGYRRAAAITVRATNARRPRRYQMRADAVRKVTFSKNRIRPRPVYGRRTRSSLFSRAIAVRIDALTSNVYSRSGTDTSVRRRRNVFRSAKKPCPPRPNDMTSCREEGVLLPRRFVYVFPHFLARLAVESIVSPRGTTSTNSTPSLFVDGTSGFQRARRWPGLVSSL